MDKKILIIEDDAFISKTIALKFKNKGYVVFAAKNADEAEAIFAKDIPDVILLDIILPGVNGFEILKHIKATEKTKNIPVVIFSNLGSKEDIEQGMSLGATKYIIKADFTPDNVVEEINTLLSQ